MGGRSILAGMAIPVLLAACPAAADPAATNATAGDTCRMLPEAPALPVLVEGVDGAFRLACRNGRLTAVPDGAARPHTSGASEAVATPAEAAPAGVAPLAAGADPAAAKPGVAAADAAPAPPGAGKDLSRLDAGDAGDAGREDAAANEAAPGPGGGTAPAAGREPANAAPRGEKPAAGELVTVPAAVVAAARRALPGIAFTTVTLSRTGGPAVYTLSGATESGRAVSVRVDESGTPRRLDRAVKGPEVPAEIRKLAEAMLSGAPVETTALSVRSGLQSYYVFSGRSAGGRPFTLEIRADGRSLAFADPQ